VKEELQRSVIMVVTQITSMGISLPVGDEVKKRLIVSLIAIFLKSGGDGKSSVKKMEGESLAQLFQSNPLKHQWKFSYGHTHKLPPLRSHRFMHSKICIPISNLHLQSPKAPMEI